MSVTRGCRLGIVAVAVCFAISCAGRKPFYKELPPTAAPEVASDDVSQRLVLIGDAGDQEGGRALLTAAGGFAEASPSSLVIFLGDNSYDRGINVTTGSIMARALNQQIRVGLDRRVLFVPGNHDWEETEPAHYRARRLDQERFTLASTAGGEAEVDYQPAKACPGPSVVSLASVKLVAIDSAWWLMDDSERATSSDCPFAIEAAVQSELERQLACDALPCVPIVVLAHHPMETHGIHGGKGPWYKWPYVAFRRALRHPQDVGSDEYKSYVGMLERAFAARSPLAFVAGHEHSLQVMSYSETGKPRVQLVSGSGSKSGYVARGEQTLFSEGKQGLMILDFLKSGRILLRAFSLNDQAELSPPVYWMWLSSGGE